MRALLLLLVIMANLQAADVPQGSKRDSRIQRVNYHPADVVVVHAAVGIISRIVFEAGENIVAVHSGFTDGYDIAPSGRILTIKPMTYNGVQPNARDWATNIAVETNKRLYDFELQLAKAGSPSVFYRIEFEYPIEQVVQRKAVRAAKALEQAKAQAAESVPRNRHYSMKLGKRSKGIAPDMAYDDGQFTFLRFPTNSEMPAVFVVNADGTEGMVNTHIDPQRPDLLVIHRVSTGFVLRLGKSVVSIINNGA